MTGSVKETLYNTGKWRQIRMERMILDKNWQMQIIGDNIYGISEDWIDAQVPESVYGNLLDRGLMPTRMIG